MTTSLSQAVKKETLIGCLINIVIASIITWVAMPKEDILPTAGGPESATFGFFPASILFTFLFTVIATKGFTKRAVAGSLVAEEQDKGLFFSIPLPKNVALRGIIFTAIATLIVAPFCVFLSILIFGSNIAYLHGFILNIVYLLAVSIILTPAVIITAVRFKPQ